MYVYMYVVEGGSNIGKLIASSLHGSPEAEGWVIFSAFFYTNLPHPHVFGRVFLLVEVRIRVIEVGRLANVLARFWAELGKHGNTTHIAQTCVYVHTYIYIYIYISIHMCIHIHIYRSVCVQEHCSYTPSPPMPICIHMYVYMYVSLLNTTASLQVEGDRETEHT